MDYIYKIYYKNKEMYNTTYNKRINGENTFFTGLKIQANKSLMDLYYIPNDNKLKKLELDLPPMIGESLLIDAISSELQSSNELEGVDLVKRA